MTLEEIERTYKVKFDWETDVDRTGTLVGKLNERWVLDRVGELGKDTKPHRSYKILRATGRINGEAYDYIGDIEFPLIVSRDKELSQFLSAYRG